MVEGGDFWRGPCQNFKILKIIMHNQPKYSSRDQLALRFLTDFPCNLGSWVRISLGYCHITSLKEYPNVKGENISHQNQPSHLSSIIWSKICWKNTRVNPNSPVRVSIVINWLCYTIKEKPNSNATSKEHDKPRNIIVFWLVIRFSQLQIWILAEIEQFYSKYNWHTVNLKE